VDAQTASVGVVALKAVRVGVGIIVKVLVQEAVRMDVREHVGHVLLIVVVLVLALHVGVKAIVVVIVV